MIQLEALTLGYGQQILLDHVSANLDGGGLIALLGRNGSGKSTLLRATAGLGTIKSGRILLAGKDLAELRPEELARTVSFVTTEKVRIPNLKCRDVVALGRAPYTNWVGRLQPQDREIVAKSLALLEKQVWDAVLLDLMLPNVDGLEICRRIRQMAGYLPVIIISARTSEIHRILGLEMGADDYLPKPCSVQELIARVKALFRRQEAMGQNIRLEGGLIRCHGLHIDHWRAKFACVAS